MNIFGIGTDIVNIKRMEKSLRKNGDAFKKRTKSEFLRIKKSATFADKIGLEAHAGHGLNYKTAYMISRIKHISELNIGHFIIAESIFISLKNSIKKFKNIINN